LPKDLRALTYCAKQFDLNTPLLRAITVSNQAHLDRAVDTVLAMNRRKIAVLGLSFKAGTDDLRESPSVQLVKRLLGEGCQVQIWDREVSLGQLWVPIASSSKNRYPISERCSRATWTQLLPALN